MKTAIRKTVKKHAEMITRSVLFVVYCMFMIAVGRKNYGG